MPAHEVYYSGQQRLAKWRFDMINCEEHKRLLDEIERLKAKNEELLAEMLMLRDMLVSVRSQKIARQIGRYFS